MLKIAWIKVNDMLGDCVTDDIPVLSFSLVSDVPGESLQKATISCGDWHVETTDQVGILYVGTLTPFTKYEVSVLAVGMSGEQAESSTSFTTGRMSTPWQAQWITDNSYIFEDKASPVPMVFRKSFSAGKPIRRALINATALGIYELALNDEKVGEDYFAPGLTSYAHQIQYQTYDITHMLQDENEITATVAGGWAAGSFNHRRRSKISADRQALLCEIRLEYEDGSNEIVGTSADWQASLHGPYRMAEWYDGETYDANIALADISWKQADITVPRGAPELLAQYGAPVRAQQVMQPISCTQAPSGEWIYDFGQNFAGVISAALTGTKGQTITFRHAEVLVGGELFVKSLRTAKATATYICRDGEQQYAPRLTYMGFRYVGVRGIAPEALTLSALVLHSDIEETGSFTCSNPLINRLQENIRWGGKSNFVDIPTDCPQRDERQGWTGDIAVFAGTACYNFDMSRFLDKWLLDMRAEQAPGGGIPMVVPRAGDAWPIHATCCWGDSCILVPWAEYLARGNKRLLEKQYPAMKKFLKAARWWSSFLSITPNGRHIWKLPYHWGDWCAPEGGFSDWVRKGKWVATAYFANSCKLVAQIADLLGKPDDAKQYRALSKRTAQAYRSVFTDGKGRLKKEFQTAYVLPLHFDMTTGDETKAMSNNLVRLVRKADTHLATGFTGTPYLLFALSDNGHADVAFELLLQETCPSWLYEVKTGGTTIWERWDALRPDGTVNTGKSDDADSGGMVSFNHYANGAVGDWLYRRIAGIEPTSGGYRTFRIEPLLGGGITMAKGSVKTPYGTVVSDWTHQDDTFTIRVNVPVSAECALILPDGEAHTLVSGEHCYTCKVPR